MNYPSATEDEHDGALALSMNSDALTKHAAHFADAVALFEVAGQESLRTNSRLVGRWQFLAARQGIVSIYNYRMAMDGVLKMRSACPAWSAAFDNARLESAKTQFRQEFKHTKELRQSLLHNSEMFWNPTNYKTNVSTKGIDNRCFKIPPGAQVVADGNLFNNIYMVQFVGQQFELEMSLKKLGVLIAITRDFFSGLKFAEGQSCDL